jgi:hypothetical protein
MLSYLWFSCSEPEKSAWSILRLFPTGQTEKISHTQKATIVTVFSIRPTETPTKSIWKRSSRVIFSGMKMIRPPFKAWSFKDVKGPVPKLRAMRFPSLTLILSHVLNCVGFCLTHREKRRFYEFEPWLIRFNSIIADICCEKTRKVVLFEEENGMRREPRKNRQIRMRLMKRYSLLDKALEQKSEIEWPSGM